MTAESVTIEDDGPVLRAVVRLPGCTVAKALTAFTDPGRLARWWGGDLHADLVPGGEYRVRFAALGRSMTGQVVSYDPARSVEFTWAWEHMTDGPRRTVAVRAESTEPTSLTIVHGPHGDGEDERAARAEHRAGWEYFLPKLAASLGC